ncbi:MAG: hypothetical protein HQL66_06695 [Magnetococcales bacterium]|nr:hypothetical protein [Magnetococcales bacterium]
MTAEEFARANASHYLGIVQGNLKRLEEARQQLKEQPASSEPQGGKKAGKAARQ